MVMVSDIILFGLVLVYTSANIAVSNRGMHFVAACPWLRHEYSCTGIVTTPELFVLLTVDKPGSRESQIKEFSIERNTPMTISIAAGNDSTMLASGIYSSVVIRASGPIRVVVASYHNTVLDNADAFVLIPKRSCHRSYFTTTTTGNPFIAVMSFDDPVTRVTVSFPLYMRSRFREKCAASDVCTNDKTVKFRLSRHKVWYLRTIHKLMNLHGARITSDFPVYVVAGNEQCTSIHFGTKDVCISAMKSIVTWGKTYIVPNVFPVKAFFIDVLEPPLLVTFHEDGKVPQRRIAKVGVLEVYGETSNAMGVTANVPFGLYQMFLSRKENEIYTGEGDASTLSLIPVEQWFHGCVFTKFPFGSSDVRIRYTIVTEAKPSDIIPENNANIIWHTSVLSVNNKVYFVGEMNIRGFQTKIHISSPSGSLILYVIMYPVNDADHHFLLSFPYEFYHGEIYQNECSVSKTFSPNDGIDNDCDGFIDEEEKNGVDDDGDGLVDEDYVEVHSDGEWGEWETLCSITCQFIPQSVRVRACVSMSPFGKHCEGESVQCNEANCPEDCGSNAECYCNAGCQTCEENIFSCDSCKAGYMPSRQCTTPCPHGWSGKGCMDGILNDSHRKAGSLQSIRFSDASILYWVILIMLSVAGTQFVIITVLCICQKDVDYDRADSWNNDADQPQGGDGGLVLPDDSLYRIDLNMSEEELGKGTPRCVSTRRGVRVDNETFQ